MLISQCCPTFSSVQKSHLGNLPMKQTRLLESDLSDPLFSSKPVLNPWMFVYKVPEVLLVPSAMLTYAAAQQLGSNDLNMRFSSGENCQTCWHLAWQRAGWTHTDLLPRPSAEKPVLWEEPWARPAVRECGRAGWPGWRGRSQAQLSAGSPSSSPSDTAALV